MVCALGSRDLSCDLRAPAVVALVFPTIRCCRCPGNNGFYTAAPPFLMKFDFTICYLALPCLDYELFLALLWFKLINGFLSVVALFFLCLKWLSFDAFVISCLVFLFSLELVNC